MKGVQCYELFGGIALKNHAFSFFFISSNLLSVLHLYTFCVNSISFQSSQKYSLKLYCRLRISNINIT